MAPVEVQKLRPVPGNPGRDRRRHPYARIGAELRFLREQAGLKAYELAARAGVSAASVSEVESGKTRPSRDYLEKVSGAIQTAVPVLLRLAGYPVPPPDAPQPTCDTLIERLVEDGLDLDVVAAFGTLLRAFVALSRRVQELERPTE